MRPIDADEVLARIENPYQRAEIARWLRDAPTIEPKKGKWVKEYWNGEHTRKCSACNITQTVTTYRGKVNFNYCPYCGADMRGDDNA